ncbi:hypothetical protein [Streptomyces purpureus]|nr:hypothetical protein [Streptomyces purpureus]
MAIDELSECVCALGFVLGDATAPTVPFLIELAGAPGVPCKAELLDLLESIYRTDQWHVAAAAAGGPRRKGYKDQPGWEVASRAAVLAGRPVIEGLSDAVQPDVAEAAQALLRAFDEDLKFPEV